MHKLEAFIALNELNQYETLVAASEALGIHRSTLSRRRSQATAVVEGAAEPKLTSEKEIVSCVKDFLASNKETSPLTMGRVFDAAIHSIEDGISVRRFSELLGVSRTVIMQCLAFLELPKEVQAYLEQEPHALTQVDVRRILASLKTVEVGLNADIAGAIFYALQASAPKSKIGDTVVKALVDGLSAPAPTVTLIEAKQAVAPRVSPQERRIRAQTDLAESLIENDTDKVERVRLEKEVQRAQTQLRRLNEQMLTDVTVREKILNIAHHKPQAPEWLADSSSIAVTDPGVPILFASDWHWGEVVNPDEIGGVNKFDLEIARARAKNMIDRAINLLTNHMVNPNYPGIVFALGGDMVSGNIHDELCETNDIPIMPVVLDIIDHLTAAILRLKETFGKVFVPCVAGNHGRIHRKPRAKQSNFNSYDWLIYQALDREFSNDPDVIFFIPDGPDALISVCGHRYLITHGDQFRGGDGMIGPIGPLCVAPETLILKTDLSYVRADSLQPGDDIIGFDEEAEPRDRRRFRSAKVEEVDVLELDCYEVETSDGQVTTASVDHPWMCRSGDANSWIKTQHLRIGTRIMSLGAPWEREDSFEAGYLGGVFDGEGTLEESGRLKISQQDNECFKKTKEILDKWGVPYRISEKDAAKRGHTPVYDLSLFNGREEGEARGKLRAETWRLLGRTRPERIIAEQAERSWEGVSIQVAEEVTVTGIRYVGKKTVAAFSTSTKTFVGNGMLMHNTRGDHKKRSRNAQVGQEYDTLVVGHFHTLIQMQRIIVNGSLKGYDEYAYKNNFGFERAQQALWITHPQHGITFSMPVQVETSIEEDQNNSGPTTKKPWVEFHDAKTTAPGDWVTRSKIREADAA